MTKGKSDAVLGTKISKPVPAKYAFNADDDVIKVRKDQLEKQLWVGFDVLVNKDFAVAIDSADIHFTSVQVDTAIVVVLLLVKSHDVASFG
jgi:hypothetical protein